MKALVTGGCGFIGSNLVHRLVEEGWEVEVVDDLSNGHLEHLEPLRVRCLNSAISKFYLKEEDSRKPEVIVHTTDFCDVSIAAKILNQNYDVIFHLAANPRVGYCVENPVATTETNFSQTVELMGYAVNNAKRFIMASTSAIYGDPMGQLPTPETANPNPASPYGLQKLCCEQFGKMFSALYDLDTVFLRLFNAYGPRQFGDSPYSTAVSAWCDKIKNELPLRSDGDGEQTRDMVYVDDIVDAFMLAAERDQDFKGKILNVGTGSRLSNNSILSTLKEKFENIEITHAPVRVGDVRDTQADISTVAEELNWKPAHDFQAGLEKTLEWWDLK